MNEDIIIKCSQLTQVICPDSGIVFKDLQSVCMNTEMTVVIYFILQNNFEFDGILFRSILRWSFKEII